MVDIEAVLLILALFGAPVAFGLWQGSLWAGVFMLCVVVAVDSYMIL